MSWIWPTTSTHITQDFTPQHQAWDIGAGEGEPVKAPWNATVEKAGWDTSGYGNLVILKTREGQRIFLAHLKNFAAKEKSDVFRGETVGYVGSTGTSTGPHLHLEIRDQTNKPVSPASFFKSQPMATDSIDASPGTPSTAAPNQVEIANQQLGKILAVGIGVVMLLMGIGSLLRKK